MECRKCGKSMVLQGRPEKYKDTVGYDWICTRCGHRTRTVEER